MTVYIGVDFHPYEQTVAFVSDEDGEISYRRFLHSDKQSIKTLAHEALGILRTSGLTPSAHIYSGNPRIMLVNGSKEWKADTVFVGQKSRRSNLLGCVASAVAARAPCSVEVIPNATA